MDELSRNARGYMMRIPAGPVRMYRAGVGDDTPTPWSPADDATVVRWYDVPNLGLADNALIQTLTDRKALGNATQATEAARPTNKVNIQNSLAMAWFDGGDDRMGLTALNLSTTHSLFLLGKFSRLGADYWISGTGDGRNHIVGLDATNISYSPHRGDGAYIEAVAHGLSAADVALLEVHRSGTSVIFGKNGAQLGAEQTLPSSVTFWIATLGQYNTFGGTFAQGYLGELIVCSTVRTGADLANFRNYFKARWAAWA